MSLDSLWFTVKSALNNVFRNAFLSIASITVLAVCLLSLGSTLLIVGNVNEFVSSIGNKSQVVIFIDENVDEEGVKRVGEELGQILNITNIKYESREQSLENYVEKLGDTSLTEGLDPDVFRPSYIFDIVDLTKFDQTMYEIEQIEEIGYFTSGDKAGEKAIRSPKEVVDTVVKVKDILQFLSVWIILLFLVISVFIITNAVKLSFFSRRVEINIMKYVGATDFYIQLPYFIEGMIIGLISGCLLYTSRCV